MQTVYTVIRDCGDGSQTVEWRKEMNDAILEKLKDNESYQSGDGVQVQEYKFPNIIDMDNWAHINHIYWADGSENEGDELED